MSWNFAKIDEALMAAAIDPSAWPKAIECIGHETGSRCSLLQPRPGESEQIGRTERGKAEQPSGAVKTAHDERSSHSADWMAEIGTESGSVVWCLSVRRGENRDPAFSAQEQKKLERLSRSLSRAAMIAQAMARASVSAALEAFDVGNIAVMLVNRLGRVVTVNKAATALLKSGIKIVDGKLCVPDPDATAEFENAVRRLVRPDCEAVLLPPIRLPRRARPPILAHPFKLENVVTNAVAEPLAAIVLIDPGSRKKSSESHLHIAFQLTPAEARLASALATGEPLDRICEQLEISKETGRNQLKSIFAKTKTRRQAELVLVMARML